MSHFTDIQQQFMRHIKQPDRFGAPSGIEDRRMKIYRDLFFNNIQGFLTNGFPVLASLYSQEQWQSLARQFFAIHQCSSPYFVDISREFVDFLQHEYEPQSEDPVFMVELAHYEWVELEVSIRQTETPIIWWDNNNHKLNNVTLHFSELAWLLSYPFPVHKISSEYRPDRPQESVYIVVYRNSDDEVQFVEVNALTAHLLTLLQQNGSMTLSALQSSLTKDLSSLPIEQVYQGAEQIVVKMLQQQVLVVSDSIKSV
ncbi:HvfC family RiPP maturation protein [Neptunicella sp.]|uniref:HvfC family RiPP maturation protein n=1 Tax=Neptunicella sp. TaxID=2125986 RepID=UPI003F691EBD